MFTLEKFTTADYPLFHTLVTNEPAMRMNLGRPPHEGVGGAIL